MICSKDLQRLRRKISKVQDDKRFEHTLGVEFTAAALAMRFGYSVDDARLAGILHDCAKCLSDNRLLQICVDKGIEISDIERRNPYLLHGKVGACLAETKYEISGDTVLNAIRYHTTGRPGMSGLEKIIFIADYIEPGRKKANRLQEIRAMAFENLNRAVVWILEDTISYLRQSSGEIDEMSRKTLEYYKTEIESIREDENE